MRARVNACVRAWVLATFACMRFHESVHVRVCGSPRVRVQSFDVNLSIDMNHN